MSETGKMPETGGIPGAASRAGRGDGDWRWMVAADPAFSLVEPGGAGAADSAGEE